MSLLTALGRFVFVVLALLLILNGCGSGDPDDGDDNGSTNNSTANMGKEGKACKDDGTCDEGLECVDDVCVKEEEEQKGGEGEACYDDGTCDEGLMCEEDKCVTEDPVKDKDTDSDGIIDSEDNCPEVDIILIALPTSGVGNVTVAKAGN